MCSTAVYTCDDMLGDKLTRSSGNQGNDTIIDNDLSVAKDEEGGGHLTPVAGVALIELNLRPFHWLHVCRERGVYILVTLSKVLQSLAMTHVVDGLLAMP